MEQLFHERKLLCGRRDRGGMQDQEARRWRDSRLAVVVSPKSLQVGSSIGGEIQLLQSRETALPHHALLLEAQVIFNVLLPPILAQAGQMRRKEAGKLCRSDLNQAIHDASPQTQRRRSLSIWISGRRSVHPR